MMKLFSNPLFDFVFQSGNFTILQVEDVLKPNVVDEGQVYSWHTYRRTHTLHSQLKLNCTVTYSAKRKSRKRLNYDFCKTGSRRRKIHPRTPPLVLEDNLIERKKQKRDAWREGVWSKKKKGKKVYFLFVSRNGQRKQIGGFEDFWRRPIAPIGYRVVEAVFCCRIVGAALFVATVPIRWRLWERHSNFPYANRHREEFEVQRVEGIADLSVRIELVD